jgi:hypothetical protein
MHLSHLSAFFGSHFQIHVGGVGRAAQHYYTGVSTCVVGFDARYRQLTDAVAVRRLIVGRQFNEDLVAIPVHLIGLSVRWYGTFQDHSLTDLRSLIGQRLQRANSIGIVQTCDETWI